MLNQTNQLIKIRSLLDAPEVYKYEPTYAVFSGVIAMEAEFGAPSQDIVLTAVTAGADGNNILLTGNGIDNLADLVAAWNAANPDNTVVLTAGDTTWVPSDAEAMQLAGALDAADVMDAALITIAAEVYISKILSIITKATYDAIQIKEYDSYTVNDMRMFYAECYYIAARFLQAWSLKYETDMQKTTYDYTTKLKGVEKSGKLYTAEEYLKTAAANIAEWEREVYAISDTRGKTSAVTLSRY